MENTIKTKLFSLNTHQGKNAKYSLTVLELQDIIDNFNIKRIYYVKNTEKAITGAHAHKEEKEIFIVQKGQIKLNIDEGKGLKEIILEENQAFFVNNYVWHQIEFLKTNSLVLALSTTNYNPDRSDYIEDYNEFKEYYNQNK